MSTGTNYASQFFSSIVNDVDTLEKNVKEFPFSSVSRFLLLYHYKKNNNPAFKDLAKQTGIYINNSFWIQYQLSKIDDEPSSMEDSSQSKKLNENIEENIPVASEESDLSADRQIAPIPVSEIEVTNESEIKNNFPEEENQNEKTEENIPVAAEQQITQIPISEMETAKESEIKNNLSEEENQNEKIEENILPAVEGQIAQIPVSEIEVANENEIKNNLSEEENQNENTEENILPAVEEQITPIPVSEMEVTNESEIKNNLSEEENQNEKTEENIPAAVEESDLSADRQITQIPVPENNNEDLIPFEPLHTVDYFASQGIKISEEALENDHLGKQVKSFTAWLKSMKKLHPGQLPEQNEVIEKIIQANAEVSNQNANVLTEAMAEVLIKQNKKEKAIEMYQKLSLINPSKSAYFAAKIESLKII